MTADLFIVCSGRNIYYTIALGFKVHSQLDLEECHTILKTMCQKILSNKLIDKIKKLHHYFYACFVEHNAKTHLVHIVVRLIFRFVSIIIEA